MSLSKISCVPIFSKNGELAQQEIAQLRAIFWSLRVLQRAGWSLKCAGRRWVKLVEGR